VRAPTAAPTAAFAAAAIALAAPAAGAPLAPEEIASVCAHAEGTAHCARLVEEVQLKRLPNLAVREGKTLKVSLYPAGVATFADTEALDGGRSYSLWDYLDPINAVLLYTTDGDSVSFTLLQRASGRRIELPNVPELAPDRQHLATADFCAKGCVNELAVWRVTRERVYKELVWKPRQTWTDAGVRWKTADALIVDYTPAKAPDGTLERRLNDPGWRQLPPP
jgi:hypothetical protein